jgi:N-acetylneuraminate synthase
MTDRIFIIAEIGINHDGQYKIAEELIKAAALSGANGIKFQYRNLENAYADGPRQIGDEILLKEITKNYLSPAEIISLTEFAQRLNIKAGISFFEENDCDDFDSEIFKFDFFKAPSVELTNTNLINRMLRLGKPVYVSLGCQSEHAIDQAFASFEGDNWVALHCVSNYPVSLHNSKLGYLRHMAKKWPRPFGYSSHDDNWEVCLLAMAMGARVIERHITFDKQAQGLDHSTSSTPDDFKKIALFAENMQLILSGNGPRVPNQGELLNLQNLGRSYYAKDTIKPGGIFALDNLVFRAPRVGLGKAEMEEFIGRSPVVTVEAGTVLSRSVFEQRTEVPEAAIEYARSKKIGIPVRLHDLASIEKKFPVGTYEFHLSFGEVLGALNACQFNTSHQYSIHLPDYINSTQLMDPFSLERQQAHDSHHILQRTVDFAKALQERSGRRVPIVGSFSVVHSDLSQFYEQYTSLLLGYQDQGVSILPQWLPPIAWYFGGSVKLHALNQKQDAEYIQKHRLPICMDVCHLFMGDSLYKFGAQSIVEKVRPYISHVHIADAKGIDGEGMHFGEGDSVNLPVIKSVIEIDCMKIIEVWQGHLDEGAGFAKALKALPRLFGQP